MSPGSPSVALARRLVADSLLRTVSFALLFALLGLSIVVGYRHTYPTEAARIEFARSFGVNKAVQLFYGVPRNLLSVGGYASWRLAGLGTVIAAVWALLVSTRAFRGDEDTGRQELVLAGVVTRRGAYVAVVVSLAAGAAILWAGTFAGLAGARLPAGGAAYLALVTVSPALVFAGVGALASQLASSRRLALELGTAVLALSFLLRVVADIGGVGALRWLTPLGWTEELRPFAGPRPLVLLLPVVATVGLLAAARTISGRRDVGSGLLRAADTAEPRLRGLSSPTAYALRAERGALAAWLAGTTLFALVVGVLSTSFTPKTISSNIQHEIGKLGGASIVTPSGALGFYFLFFVLVISLFACSQVAAARREEADQQLETLLTLPVGRTSWLGGRLLLAAAAAAVLALVAGATAWAGAAAQSAGVPLPRMLEAGANCLPAAILFLGLGVLAYALWPRAGAGLAYGLVVVAFVWSLLGALVGAPRWLLDSTPFQHVGLVPAEPFRTTAALAMVAIGIGGCIGALAAFRRRDLAGT